MRRRSDSLKANLCQAQQRDLKTIAPLSHRPIVLTDTIDYRFLHYRPNPTYHTVTDSTSLASWGSLNRVLRPSQGPGPQATPDKILSRLTSFVWLAKKVKRGRVNARSQKGSAILFPVTWPNADRFSKFFHRQICQ